jgi:hypothetical protein
MNLTAVTVLQRAKNDPKAKPFTPLEILTRPVLSYLSLTSAPIKLNGTIGNKEYPRTLIVA